MHAAEAHVVVRGADEDQLTGARHGAADGALQLLAQRAQLGTFVFTGPEPGAELLPRHLLLVLAAAVSSTVAFDATRCADYASKGHCTHSKYKEYMGKFCASSCAEGDCGLSRLADPPARARCAHSSPGTSRASAA